MTYTSAESTIRGEHTAIVEGFRCGDHPVKLYNRAGRAP